MSLFHNRLVNYPQRLNMTLQYSMRVSMDDEYIKRVAAFRSSSSYYFTKVDEWYRYPPCYTLPKVDPRSFINCCPLAVDCPIRDALLLAFFSRPTTARDLEFVRSKFERVIRNEGGIFLRRLRK